MKLIIKIFTLSFIFLQLACTEIIDIQTNSSESQIIVEGGIASNEFARISITKSINLNDSDNFPVVNNALVTITELNGDSEILHETRPGMYESKTLVGKPGKTYNLKVETEDQTITSTCTIPQPIAVDSFSVVNSVYPGSGQATGNQPANFYIFTINYSDPADVENFYRVSVSINGIPNSSNRVYSDQYNNGNKVSLNLVMYSEEIKSGDIINVDFQCIDKSVYNYFNSISNGAMGSSPANPYTNLSGAILGYFSAHTSEKLEYIVL